ncbi:MAG: tetratricopeptide repeat protein [Myxococcales bacterium]|nr:tetratricopeptide repeat protein [Myxococcales bacterium]
MSPPPLRGPRYLVAASLVLAVACWASCLANPFVYDDVPLIETNALLRSTGGLWTFFTHAKITSGPIWPHHYRPILMTTVWLNYQLGGVDPIGYRATNLVIHLVNGWLAWCLLRRMQRRWLPAATNDWASAFGASLFLLHPVQSIALDLVLKRNSSLCTLFMFAGLLLFARANDGRPRRWLSLAAAVACGALAMLTKEDAFVMPLLVALVVWATGEGRLRQALAFAVAPALFIARIAPHETVVNARGSALGHLLAQPIAVARYFEMLVHPDAIAIAYDLEPVRDPFPWARLMALVAIVVAICALWLLRRRWPLVAGATAWMLIFLLPTSSVFPIFLTMDEVRCYGAFLLLYGLVGIAIVRLKDGLATRTAALATSPLLSLSPWLLLCLALLVTDWRINRAWSDPLELYAHAVERYPASQLGNRGLCEQLFARTAGDLAIQRCERAVQLWPTDAMSRYYLVGALAKAGRFEAADRVARAAIRDFPDVDVVWTALGHLSWLRDDYATAAQAYRRALATNPLDDSVRTHLADVLLAEGDRAAARALVDSFAGAPPGGPADVRLLASVASRLEAAPAR